MFTVPQNGEQTRTLDDSIFGAPVSFGDNVLSLDNAQKARLGEPQKGQQTQAEGAQELQQAMQTLQQAGGQNSAGGVNTGELATKLREAGQSVMAEIQQNGSPKNGYSGIQQLTQPIQQILQTAPPQIQKMGSEGMKLIQQGQQGIQEGTAKQGQGEGLISQGLGMIAKAMAMMGNPFTAAIAAALMAIGKMMEGKGKTLKTQGEQQQTQGEQKTQQGQGWNEKAANQYQISSQKIEAFRGRANGNPQPTQEQRSSEKKSGTGGLLNTIGGLVTNVAGGFLEKIPVVGGIAKTLLGGLFK